MRVTVLGTGNRFALDVPPAAYLVEEGPLSLVVNAGYKIPELLQSYLPLQKVGAYTLMSDEAYTSACIDQLALRYRFIYGTKPYLISQFPTIVSKRIPAYVNEDLQSIAMKDCFSITTCPSVTIGKLLTVRLIPIKSKAAAIHVVNSSGRSVLFTGECQGISSMLIPLPFEKADVIFQSVALEAERDCISYQKALLELSHPRRFFTEYRDRDLLTGLSDGSLAEPGMTLEI